MDYYYEQTLADLAHEQAQTQPRDAMGAALYCNEDGEPMFG